MLYYKKLYFKYLLMLLTAFLFTGCGQKETTPSESEVTIAFFDAVYNEKNFEKAILLCSPELKKKIQKYKTAKIMARRLLNLSFDSVEIKAQKSDTQIINDHNSQVTMTVLFTGKRSDRIYKDYREVRLIKKNDIWLVDKLLDGI